jgi:hypothetical protein
MHCLLIKPIGSVLKRLMIIVVPGFLLSPAACYAESLKLSYALVKENFTSAAVVREVKKPAEQRSFLSMDENGDVVLRSGNISLVVAYNSADDVQRYQDRPRDTQPLERPLMNGISLRLCCPF